MVLCEGPLVEGCTLNDLNVVGHAVIDPEYPSHIPSGRFFAAL